MYEVWGIYSYMWERVATKATREAALQVVEQKVADHGKRAFMLVPVAHKREHLTQEELRLVPWQGEMVC
jgi:hypothetical protein